MAGKKNKKAQATPPSSGDAGRQEVERLFRKEHYKDAVKQAKILFRDAATGENHRLLERAYLLRAQQLLKAGMPSSAIEVAGHLVEFGVTDPALVEEGARLLLALGMSRQADALVGRVESPEVRAELGLIAADGAVVHPERAASASAEIQQGARLVRSALEAVEAGDEAGAMERLREVSRNSPFADWKLFARGLAAFRRRELQEAGANWDRLEPRRAASRIARALLGRGPAAATSGESSRPAAGPDFAALERAVFGEPVLAPLDRVRDLLAKDQWPEAVRELGPVRHALRRIEPAWAQRLTRILVLPLIRVAADQGYQEAMNLFNHFTRLAEPLPIDPNWNRLKALIWEGPRGDGESAAEYWARYLDDLKMATGLAPEEQALAQALVWKHLAELSLDEAEGTYDADEEDDGDDVEDSPGVPGARSRVVACLQECIRLAPTHIPAYEMLYEVLDRWDRPEEAEAAAGQLLERFPDHFDTLVFLANHHLELEQPEQALTFAKRAHALKPLDTELTILEVDAHHAMAHDLGLRGRFEEGRAEFAVVEEMLPPDPTERYKFLASRAAFELRAGRADLAETLITEARKLLPEPGPLWLALMIESNRYDLPGADRDRFAGLFQAALKARFRGATAAAMADLVDDYRERGIEYPDYGERTHEIVAYIRRGGTRVKYTAEELTTVCTFLQRFPDESKLLEKLLKSAVKKFPDEATLHFLSGMAEIKKGPFACRPGEAKRHLERALSLAQASSRPRDADLLPSLKEGLALVEKLRSASFGLPFGIPFPGFRGKPPSFDDLFGRFDDFDYDDDDDDFGAPMDPLPLPQPGRRPRPKRRRR